VDGGTAVLTGADDPGVHHDLILGSVRHRSVTGAAGARESGIDVRRGAD
jgi:hypothetical protein